MQITRTLLVLAAGATLLSSAALAEPGCRIPADRGNAVSITIGKSADGNILAASDLSRGKMMDDMGMTTVMQSGSGWLTSSASGKTAAQRDEAYRQEQHDRAIAERCERNRREREDREAQRNEAYRQEQHDRAIAERCERNQHERDHREEQRAEREHQQHDEHASSDHEHNGPHDWKR